MITYLVLAEHKHVCQERGLVEYHEYIQFLANIKLTLFISLGL